MELLAAIGVLAIVRFVMRWAEARSLRKSPGEQERTARALDGYGGSYPSDWD